VGAQPDKDMQAEQLLCWNGMTDTGHCTTSSSNEEDCLWDTKTTI